jgi:hypothetical protein
VPSPALDELAGPLWVSATGARLSFSGVGLVLTETTHRTLGVAVDPHLFRTAAAITAAYLRGGNRTLQAVCCSTLAGAQQPNTITVPLRCKQPSSTGGCCAVKDPRSTVYAWTSEKKALSEPNHGTAFAPDLTRHLCLR